MVYDPADREAAAQMSATSSRRWRHVKTGGTYVEVGRGKMQFDMESVVIYRSDKDGSLWVRPVDEFEDGRFEEIVESSMKPAALDERERAARIVEGRPFLTFYRQWPWLGAGNRSRDSELVKFADAAADHIRKGGNP